MPSDFTFDEMQRLLEGYGYEKSDKGRTSGSRVIFKNGDKRPIMLHKPHPGNIVKGYAMKQVYDDLKEAGFIKKQRRTNDMNTMTYKGYLGSVAFSEKDNVFFGKIEGINGLVNFEGESVNELTEAFHEAVDDYLAYCEDEGIEPDKSYSGVLNVRLTPTIHRRIAILARQAGVTLNAYIKEALEEKVEESVTI